MIPIPAPTTWEAFLGGFCTAALATAPDPATVARLEPGAVDAISALFAEWLREHREHLSQATM